MLNPKLGKDANQEQLLDQSESLRRTLFQTITQTPDTSKPKKFVHPS
jgi:hypothetical protein